MTNLLEVQGVSKSFGATQALRQVDLSLVPGEVHGLVGENGAGKSTLMKIVAGAASPDSGELRWRGAPVTFRRPLDANRAGIVMIHQELSLVPQLTAAENIFLGHWPRGRWGWLDRRRMERGARRLMESVGLRRRPDQTVGSLTIAEMQLLEIARALSFGATLLIMDEPTSSLSAPEIKRLFSLVGELVGRGATVVYISHRLDELRSLANRVTVMRDGRTVACRNLRELGTREMIRLMAGDSPATERATGGSRIGPEIFRADSVSFDPIVRGVSFSVRAGEVVGLAGLMGAGRTDLAEGIFGAKPLRAGNMRLAGASFAPDSPVDAVRAGVGLVGEDRRRTGLVQGRSLWENVVLASQRKHAQWDFFDQTRERSEVEGLVASLSIRSAGLLCPVDRLSGGNQQKVLLARWLYAESRFLILDEPTRGIDVRAKSQVYELVRSLKGAGVGVLLISSEMSEIVDLSDRVLVMREGRLAGELPANCGEEQILKLAMTG